MIYCDQNKTLILKNGGNLESFKSLNRKIAGITKNFKWKMLEFNGIYKTKTEETLKEKKTEFFGQVQISNTNCENFEIKSWKF